MSIISVIIPNYQGEKWLALTMDSCLQQKEYLKEIIVIDDHSADDSWNILTAYRTRYPELVRIYKNEQKGGNQARNYGYDLSTGDFIQWLDADDQLLPGKFAAQLAVFQAHEDTDIVYSDWELDHYNDRGKLVCSEYKVHRPYEDFLLELLIDNWSPPHNYLVKRSFAGKLRKLNAWNPETPVFQDREYFTIAAINGAKFRYAPGVFCVYNRWSKTSVSQNKGKRNAVLLQLFSQFREQIADSKELAPMKKIFYRKVIITNKLLATLSRDDFPTMDSEMKFGNICWSILKDHRTKAKLFFALVLNLFFPGKKA